MARSWYNSTPLPSRTWETQAGGLLKLPRQPWFERARPSLKTKVSGISQN